MGAAPSQALFTKYANISTRAHRILLVLHGHQSGSVRTSAIPCRAAVIRLAGDLLAGLLWPRRGIGEGARPAPLCFADAATLSVRRFRRVLSKHPETPATEV